MPAVLARAHGAPAESWTEQAKLLAMDGESSDLFGWSVSLSGATALVGAHLDDDNGFNSGSAYVFVRSGEVWTEEAKLLPMDGEEDDRFGYSVALSGNTALIGAPEDDDNGVLSGSAYVLVRSGGVWSEQAKLLAMDGDAGDGFGVSVSLSGDTALVGASGDEDNGLGSGSAYVFVRSGGVWTEQAKLLSVDGDVGDEFGLSVSLSGDTALVGAPLDDNENGFLAGAAYVFARSAEVWTEQARLLPGDGSGVNEFGASVALRNNTALVGSHLDEDNGEDSGSAYVFVRSGGFWSEQGKLLPKDGAAGDEFGWSVSLRGDAALVGSVGDDNANGVSAGSAYVFGRSGGVWAEQAKLLAMNGQPHDDFGVSVSLNGDTALVGADSVGLNSGAAYVFVATSLDISVAGACPGPVTVTVTNAPPQSEVAVVAAANTNGFVKGGVLCNGTIFEVGEPFQLPPLSIEVDTGGMGSGEITLEENRCWMEALALASCETSSAVLIE